MKPTSVVLASWARQSRSSASSKKRRNKRLTGVGAHVGAMFPIRPDVLWALDFQFDTTTDGHTVKMLAHLRGRPPAFVRFDNGPEFIAHTVADWCRFTGHTSWEIADWAGTSEA